ncbi:unnamed protein product, partial [Closterium sp. NIES-65]
GVPLPPSCPLSPLLLRPTLLGLSRSVRRLPLAGNAALARARGARARVELAGVEEVAVEAAEGVGVAVGVVAGVEVSVVAVEAEAAEAVAVVAEAAVVAEVEEAVVEEVEVVGKALRSGVALVVFSVSSSSSSVLGHSPPQQLREWYAQRQRGTGEAAALGASEAAALGATASASSSAGESALSGCGGSPVYSCKSAGDPLLGRSHTPHLATFTRRPGSSLYTLTIESPPVPASGQVAASGQVFAAASRGAYGLPLTPLSFPREAPLQTLHMDVWGPARVRGQGNECYFLLVVDDYSRYTTVFPLRSKGDVTEVLIDWIRAARLQLRRSFGSDFPVLCLHSDRGGEFSFGLLRAYCRARGIRQTFTLPDSPQQNGIAERHIGMVMDVARTSMIHAAAPHFLWPFAVRYAAHQINLHPRSPCRVLPSLAMDGKVGDASAFHVWGSWAFVRDLSADKLSPRAAPCVFLASTLTPQGGSSTTPPLVVFYPPRTSRVSQVDAVEPVEVAGDSGTAAGAEPGGADSGVLRKRPGGAATGGAEPGGSTTGGAEPGCPSPGVAASGAATPWGAEPVAAGPAHVTSGSAGLGGSPGSSRREPLSPQEAREWFARRWRRTAGAGASSSAVGAGAAGPEVLVPTGAGAAEGVALRLLLSLLAAVLLRVLLVLLEVLQLEVLLALLLLEVLRVLVLSLLCLESLRGHGYTSFRSFSRFLVLSFFACRPESDSLRAASPTVTRLLATVVTDPSFESTAASALVAVLVDFAARCRLDYAASLVAEFASVCPPSVGGECALGTDVLEDRQEEFQCLAAASPHLASVLLTPEGDPDALDIPTPRSYVEAVEGPYSSQWQAAMDAKMASWKSIGTYVDAVPPPGANIVSGMWIFRVKRPPCFPPVFKARYVARGFSQRQGVDYFQTFSPTPKMTTLFGLHEEIWLRRPPGFTGTFPPCTQWSLRRPVYGLRQAPREWHDTLRTTLAALGFAPSTADPSLFLRTDTSLPPFYILVYVDDLVFATADTAGLAHVKSELQKRHNSHMVQQVLQRFGFTYSLPQATPLSTRHSLSALPSDESVESSGPYPELVGCLMYLMTCTRPDLAYPLSILARYVATGRHRPEHMAAAKRVLCYFCSTSGMGLVLGGRSPVVLTGHADASWADDQATQRSSQGYTFSLGSGSISWPATRSSSVLGSSCEAEIYAGAMAAQELRWLTYLLTDLGEPPRSPPVLSAVHWKGRCSSWLRKQAYVPVRLLVQVGS